MNTDFTAIIKKSGEWWLGWVEEIPGLNCQELTREGLVETLRQFVGAQFIASFRKPMAGKPGVMNVAPTKKLVYNQVL